MEYSKREREFAAKILSARTSGNLKEAILNCLEAVEQFSDSDFFYKILGDLYFQNNQPNEAMASYIEFLKKIKEKSEMFPKFILFFNRYADKYQVNQESYGDLSQIITDTSYPAYIRQGLVKIIIENYHATEEIQKILEQCEGKCEIRTIRDFINKNQQRNIGAIIYFLSKVSAKHSSSKTNNVDLYLAAQMEKYSLFYEAIALIYNLLKTTDNGVAIRTLFRLCRKIDNYEQAELYLEQNQGVIKKSDFNIQYELIWYFDFIHDEEKRNQSLELVKKNSSKASLPISKTLYNFYLKFGMLNEASQLQSLILELGKKKARTKQDELKIETETETEEAVWLKIKGLEDEQEHNRQLIAIKELIKGFAHELGQPITNIRYGIQLFQMKENKIGDEKQYNELCELFGNILEQTERVGRLLNRFSPIISSRSIEEKFNIFDVVKNTFDGLSSRLKNEDIEYRIKGSKKIYLYGEKLQFDQVFSNLIINSISAIKKKDQHGEITVNLKQNDSDIRIEFSDNGAGIAKENRKKIFEPFYSTKDKKTEEGGEGLGLFIVWNILKIFSGSIRVDETYKPGAKFIITIKRGDLNG